MRAYECLVGQVELHESLQSETRPAAMCVRQGFYARFSGLGESEVMKRLGNNEKIERNGQGALFDVFLFSSMIHLPFIFLLSTWCESAHWRQAAAWRTWCHGIGVSGMLAPSFWRGRMPSDELRHFVASLVEFCVAQDLALHWSLGGGS